MEDNLVSQNYTFALNLAIQAKADASTLELLAKAATGVLATEDGELQEGPLSVLLKTKP